MAPMLVNGLDIVCTNAAPRCHTENLMLQVWASLYRFTGDVENGMFRSYKALQNRQWTRCRFAWMFVPHILSCKPPSRTLRLSAALC